MSAKKSPIFPIPEPQHFSDYGFDPQLDFFQVLGEARRHKREAAAARPIDSVHFKLQKPISKDDHSHHHQKSKRSFSYSSSSFHHKFKSKTRWWRNALLFFKRWAHHHHDNHDQHQQCDRIDDQRRAGSRPPFRGSVSGPVYLAESRSGPPGTPYRTASRPSSGPLAGTLTPARKGDVEVPYVSLGDLNMEPPQRISTSSAIPIYLVT